MKKLLFILFILQASFGANAQVVDGLYTISTTTIRFTNGAIPLYLPDTATVPLWQIGHTHKPFFCGDTSIIPGVMTDSLNHYPVNANNWFTIKVPSYYNVIVNFWHKYQTDSSHAGGIVEFSRDHGMTWQNIKGDCNVDSSGTGWTLPGVKTTNFYGFHDTLGSGEPAFTGVSNTQQYSRFQFLGPLPTKTTSGIPCTFGGSDTLYVRFRFVSDTTTDTLAGWIIDSVNIQRDQYLMGVTKMSRQQSLDVFPSPSYDGNFSFPALANEERYTIAIYNAMGQQVLKMPYGHSLQLGDVPKGVYLYKVTDGTEYYSGRLMYE